LHRGGRPLRQTRHRRGTVRSVRGGGGGRLCSCKLVVVLFVGWWTEADVCEPDLISEVHAWNVAQGHRPPGSREECLISKHRLPTTNLVVLTVTMSWWCLTHCGVCANHPVPPCLCVWMSICAQVTSSAVALVRSLTCCRWPTTSPSSPASAACVEANTERE